MLASAIMSDAQRLPTWRETSLHGSTERAGRPPHRSQCDCRDVRRQTGGVPVRPCPADTSKRAGRLRVGRWLGSPQTENRRRPPRRSVTVDRIAGATRSATGRTETLVQAVMSTVDSPQGTPTSPLFVSPTTLSCAEKYPFAGSRSRATDHALSSVSLALARVRPSVNRMPYAGAR
jgi:hypothetical protein